MGFLSPVIRPMANAPTYNPSDDRWYFPGGSFYGGLPVSNDSAMRLITVQNCVRVRAATISQLPCHVFEKLGNDDFKEVPDFYLYNLLNDQPNSWMESPIFWAMVEAFICTRGNFIAYKLGIEGRPVRELIPITDKVVKVEQNKDYSLTYYVRFNNGEEVLVPQNKIMHIRGLLTFDGIMGVNPIEYSRETIGLGTSQVAFLGNFFSKGMHPGAIFRHPMTLDPITHANKREALRQKYSGLGKTWEMMLIDENMTVEFPKITLVDAQYLEIMKMTEAQICGLYRVPLMLIQSGDKTPTYASAEQFMINYCVIGVAPDCRNYEKTIQSSLMSQEERKKYFVKFNIDALLRGDFKTRMEGFNIGINAEIINPNEARKKMEMRPYKGGDEYRTRTSTIKQDSKNSDTSDNPPDKKQEKGVDNDKS